MSEKRISREVGCAKIYNIFFKPQKNNCIAFIDIKVSDRPGLLLDILKVISGELKYNILSLNSYVSAENGKGEHGYCVRLAVESTSGFIEGIKCGDMMKADLGRVELRLREIDGVLDVSFEIQEREKMVIDTAFPVVFKFGPIMTEAVILRKGAVKNLFRRQLEILGEELGQAVIFSMGFSYGLEVGKSYMLLKDMFMNHPSIAGTSDPEEKRRKLVDMILRYTLDSYRALGLGYPDMSTYKPDFDAKIFKVMVYDNVDVPPCLFVRGIYAGVVTEVYRRVYGEVDPAYRMITFTAVADNIEEVDVTERDLPIKLPYLDPKIVNCHITVMEYTEE